MKNNLGFPGVSKRRLCKRKKESEVVRRRVDVRGGRRYQVYGKRHRAAIMRLGEGWRRKMRVRGGGRRRKKGVFAGPRVGVTGGS